MKPKLAVILYKSKTLSNGEHPLMLRVTCQSKRKYVAIGISCPQKWWDDKKNLPKRTHPNKDFIKALIEQKILAYQNQLLEAPQLALSPQALIHAVENPKKRPAFSSFLDELIDRFDNSARVGNANIYKDTKRALRHFIGNAPLLFSDIDPRFLSQFESFLRSKKLADNTLFTYFKTIRAVFNKAIQEGILEEVYYPFKVFNLSKFNTTTRKRAISKKVYS
ncbi:MAG: phage integrase SAM-like domain and Arm DNA-binding domain-containing protein [Roseivirga sp.]